jgi:hypothetical protein
MNNSRNRLMMVCAAMAVLCAGLVWGAAADAKTPKSVLHVVTVQWAPDSTPAQQQAAVDGVKTMAGKIPGMTRVWLKTVKAQGGANAVIAMEFRDQAAFDAYADHPAHREWE